MVAHLLFKLGGPIALPVAMVGLNALSLGMGICFERRVKENALKYLLLYWSTIPAARRGDLGPFLVVAQGR